MPDVKLRQKALSLFAIKCGFAVAAVAAAAAAATPIIIALTVIQSQCGLCV